MSINKESITNKIKAEAKRLGFSDCGISYAENLINEEVHLIDWLNNGYHSEMHYMENHFEKRLNPTLLVDDAYSVISLSLNYFPGKTEYIKGQARISKYALGRDYHKVMKKMLKDLFQYILSIAPETKGRYFVDSAPVMDKAWAEKSGIGWRGKNGNIISKDKGSFFFIGEIICNLEMEYDKPVKSYCSDCQLCLDACPTNAITKPYVVDANRCISYQTIENQQEIPNSIVKNLNDYIFGCDICQDVCPWNNKSIISHIKDFGSRLDINSLSYQDYKEMNEEDFDNIFNGTPVKRAGFNKIKQTVNQICKDD
jgi:epoxyqueuosine reductase